MRTSFNLYAVLPCSGMAYCPVGHRETAPKLREVFGKNTRQKPCGTALNRTAALSIRESVRSCAAVMPCPPTCP